MDNILLQLNESGTNVLEDEFGADVSITESGIADFSSLKIGGVEVINSSRAMTNITGGFVSTASSTNIVASQSIFDKVRIGTNKIDITDSSDLVLESSGGVINCLSNITGLTPTASNHLSTKQYVDDNVGGGSGDLKADGTVAMTGDFNCDDNKVINVATPTAGTDAVNKTYCDANHSFVSTADAILDMDGFAIQDAISYETRDIGAGKISIASNSITSSLGDSLVISANTEDVTFSGGDLSNIGDITCTNLNLGNTNISHYEEGTWTPVEDSTSNIEGVRVYSHTTYVRINDRVEIMGEIDNLDSTSASNVMNVITLSGLPFTADTGLPSTGIANYYRASGDVIQHGTMFLASTTTAKLIIQQNYTGTTGVCRFKMVYYV